MYVKSLDLDNFRNYRSLSIEFDRGINILYGSNAQGKTNILEAVCLAGTTKSHRGSKDRDMIRMGEEESHIRMFIDRRGIDYRIDLHLRKNKAKGAALGGVPVKRAAEIFGLVSLVFFSPEDLNIIKNGPAARRKFLDQLLSGIDRLYLNDLTTYSKILSQRSALLHELQYHPDRMGELDVWDLQLSVVGERIIAAREEFLKKFNETAAQKHASLSGNKERLELLYEPNTKKGQLEERLLKNRDSDLRMKLTGAGPHRDDILIRADGMDLRTFGSQGQQRTAALSMKMAEIVTIEKEKGEMPVLLLDDVLSELDSDRQRALLSSIRDTQTLITCTGLDDFVQNSFQADKLFYVEQGTIKDQSPHDGLQF
ncbi:MAG: DNA replication/repair protein RecF [Lachnospiraceae bacterium]|nr:DNA replication/repair protein RecF [Lachnospiraceae bacterium]